MMSTMSTLLWPFLLGATRFTPLLALPGIALFTQLPVLVRLGLVATLAALTAYALPTEQLAIPHEPVSAVFALAGEFILGVTFAFSIHLAFGVLRFMGRLVDMQIGFAAAGIVDPTTQRIEALLGSALAFAALVTLFNWDIHHDLIRGIAVSMQLVPLGTATLTVGPDWLALLVGRQFLFGFMLVAPIVIGLLLVDVVIAYAARLMPQVNVYFIGLPLKIGIGLLLTGVVLSNAATPLRRLLDSAVSAWVTAMGSA